MDVWAGSVQARRQTRYGARLLQAWFGSIPRLGAGGGGSVSVVVHYYCSKAQAAARRGSKDEGVAGVVVGGERGRVGGRPRDGTDGYQPRRKWRATHRDDRSLQTWQGR